MMIFDTKRELEAYSDDYLEFLELSGIDPSGQLCGDAVQHLPRQPEQEHGRCGNHDDVGE